jgi:hypothetical protein
MVQVGSSAWNLRFDISFCALQAQPARDLKPHHSFSGQAQRDFIEYAITPPFAFGLLLAVETFGDNFIALVLRPWRFSSGCLSLCCTTAPCSRISIVPRPLEAAENAFERAIPAAGRIAPESAATAASRAVVAIVTAQTAAGAGAIIPAIIPAVVASTISAIVAAPIVTAIISFLGMHGKCARGEPLSRRQNGERQNHEQRYPCSDCRNSAIGRYFHVCTPPEIAIRPIGK